MMMMMMMMMITWYKSCPILDQTLHQDMTFCTIWRSIVYRLKLTCDISIIQSHIWRRYQYLDCKQCHNQFYKCVTSICAFDWISLLMFPFIVRCCQWDTLKPSLFQWNNLCSSYIVRKNILRLLSITISCRGITNALYDDDTTDGDDRCYYDCDIWISLCFFYYLYW